MTPCSMIKMVTNVLEKYVTVSSIPKTEAPNSSKKSIPIDKTT